MTPYEAEQERATGYSDAVDDIFSIWRRVDDGKNVLGLADAIERWLGEHA